MLYWQPSEPAGFSLPSLVIQGLVAAGTLALAGVAYYQIRHSAKVARAHARRQLHFRAAFLLDILSQLPADQTERPAGRRDETLWETADLRSLENAAAQMGSDVPEVARVASRSLRGLLELTESARSVTEGRRRALLWRNVPWEGEDDQRTWTGLYQSAEDALERLVDLTN